MLARSLTATQGRPILILIGRAIAIVITRVGERRVDLRVHAPRGIPVSAEIMDADRCRNAVSAAQDAAAGMESVTVARDAQNMV